MKLIYDDLLDAYFDENNKIVKGIPVVEKHSYNGEYEVKDIIKGENKDGNKDSQ